MLFPSILLLLLLMVVATIKAGDGHSALKCPDGSLAISNGLHACCGEPPLYCTLCARMVKGYESSCTTHCNGTVIKAHPYCKDCVCLTLPPSNNDPDARVRGGCPFGHGKKK